MRAPARNSSLTLISQVKKSVLAPFLAPFLPRDPKKKTGLEEAGFRD